MLKTLLYCVKGFFVWVADPFFSSFFRFLLRELRCKGLKLKWKGLSPLLRVPHTPLTVEGVLLGDAAEPDPRPDGWPHLVDALLPPPEDALPHEYICRGQTFLPLLLLTELWGLGLGRELLCFSHEWYKHNLDGITFPSRPVKQILDVGAKTEIHNFKTTEPSRRGVSLARKGKTNILCLSSTAFNFGSVNAFLSENS